MRLPALATFTAAAALACTVPALAQSTITAADRATVDELVVTGHLNGAHLQTMSETVSYADLDLTYARDRERLRLRINDSARRICTRLNQDRPNPTNMGRSCQELAVRGAMEQVRFAFADARDRAYADTFGEPAGAVVTDPDYVPPPPPVYDPR